MGVLPRYHGRLSEESVRLPLHVQSSLLSRIVAPFDVVKDIGPGFGSCPIVVPIHAFTFKHSEEAFGGGVVGAAAHRTHAAQNTDNIF